MFGGWGGVSRRELSTLPFLSVLNAEAASTDPTGGREQVLFFFLKQSLSRLVVSNSLWPHGRKPTRLPCPWDSPDKNTGVGCHPFSRGASLPRDQTQVSCVSCVAARFFTCWAIREAHLYPLQNRLKATLPVDPNAWERFWILDSDMCSKSQGPQNRHFYYFLRCPQPCQICLYLRAHTGVFTSEYTPPKEKSNIFIYKKIISCYILVLWYSIINLFCIDEFSKAQNWWLLKIILLK